ncbi:hypothetical protein [Haloarcula salina]|uniref:Uncharacterized protein n=1 Tax=Haloarcula salina TaxID=1429914 RepID=A0AA41KG60_9EURY|nr:hypothetical protein [Haloarcula salina]MBV0902742.1 hypothetical protein [Haloarcula salina]
MKRRTFLTGSALVSVPSVEQLLQWLQRVNQGQIVAKRLIAVPEPGSERREIAAVDANGTSVVSDHEDLLAESAGSITTAAATELRTQYRELRFQVTVSHHETSLGRPTDGEPVEYETSRVLYSGMDIGDHATFQTSLLDEDSLVSLSCLTEDKSSLRQRCRVGIENPTED